MNCLHDGYIILCLACRAICRKNTLRMSLWPEEPLDKKYAIGEESLYLGTSTGGRTDAMEFLP